MFCSNCSQKKTSENIRFCSRCGFRFNAVNVPNGDGDLILLRGDEPRSSGRWLRKKDMTIGAVLMFFMAWRSVWATGDLSFESKITGLLLNCFILAVAVNLFPVVRDYFRRKASARNENSAPENFFESARRFNGGDHGCALPAACEHTAGDYFASGIKTAEFAAPPSVTVATTGLLSCDLK